MKIKGYSGYREVEVTEEQWALALRRAKAEQEMRAADSELAWSVGRSELYKYLSLRDAAIAATEPMREPFEGGC